MTIDIKKIYIVDIKSVKETAMSAVKEMKEESIQLRYKSDTPNTVSRNTVRNMAAALGYNETQLIHHALRKLSKEILPSYEQDNGELSAQTVEALRKVVPKGKLKSVRSSLF